MTNCSQVCCLCGKETRILPLDTYNKYSAPLSRNYDRKNRFGVKVCKLLGMHSGPPAHDKVWKMLENHTMESPACVRKTIRNSKLNTKHYDCVRVFCDVFTKFRVRGYDPHVMKKYLESCFAEVHRCWCRVDGVSDSFFSYDFLLRYFLEQIQSPLLVYLKPKTNKRRLKKYLMKLEFIRFPGVCKTYCRSFGVDHFPNE